jgi:hypothetical protein
VRSSGITAPSVISGPPVYPGANCTNRAATRFCATITAFASAGTRTPWSTRSVSVTLVPVGEMPVTVPAFTPAIRTSSPG